MAKKTPKAIFNEPDPNLQFSTGEFTLPNGDQYSGEYCAHRYGLIWREGNGVYTAKDGESYEGEWKDDKLVKEKDVTIRYTSGEKFCGHVVQDKYSGPGIYTVADNMDITCEFADNKPQGNIILIDIDERIWEGKASEIDCLLLPENHFYHNITNEEGMGKFKQTFEQNESVGKQQIKEFTEQELEKIFFAKSNKTANDINFIESKWYQKYLRYRTMKDSIAQKSDPAEEEKITEGSEERFVDEEQKWAEKYEKYKQERKEKKRQKQLDKERARKIDTSLLQTFYGKEFKESCPAMKVFRPTCDYPSDTENLAETAKTNSKTSIKCENKE